jgi:hypothetical protein
MVLWSFRRLFELWPQHRLEYFIALGSIGKVGRFVTVRWSKP